MKENVEKYYAGKIDIIEDAIFEARRFVKRAKAWEKRIIKDDSIWASKESSACKRTSMDLTRALAILRK